MIERFFNLFESIIRYHHDLNHLIQEVEEGQFIETLDSLLSQDEPKQILAEAYYYYAIMLIILDNLVPGVIREKIVICHMRFEGGQNSVPNLHEICKLCKSTGFIPEWYPNDKERPAFLNKNKLAVDPELAKNMSKKELKDARAKRPKGQTIEKFLKRFPIKMQVVSALILNIKDGDIYKQSRAYPVPEHRSFALASQASILYVL